MSKPFELFSNILERYEVDLTDPDVKELSSFLEALSSAKKEKPLLTDSGLAILEYMQGCDASNMKAKDIGEGMGIPSKKVSGSIRKLCTDGFVEKAGQTPVIYSLTAKGKEFDIQAYKDSMIEDKEEE